MKSFLHFIIIVFSSIALSCCSNNTSTKNSEAEFYMVSWENVYWENLYRCYDGREDTLLNGLANVNKEVRRYSDGSKKVVMELIIDESDSLTGPYTRCVYLDAAEISKFDAFID